MRLTVCSPQLGIAPQSNSGGEVYDREVIKSLCNQGVKVIVILPFKKPYLCHKNLKVYYLPFPFIWPPYLFNFFIIPYLFYLYKKHKFNVLRIHNPYFVGLGGLFFKLFHPQVSLITTYHHLEKSEPFFDLIDKLFIKKWDRIIAVSQFTKEEIIKKYHLQPKKISLVYNGLEEKFKPQRKRKDLLKKYQLENKKVLLFLGGLKQRKNTPFLLSLIKQIKDPQVKLLICGSGRQSNKLLKQVKKLKIKKKVAFTGFVPEQEKVDYYNLGDVFLFPSKKEGFGLPIIEAGACCLPSIASNSSSLKELVINNQTGYLVEQGNLQQWQEKVEKLVKDENLRKKMGKKARKFSQNFSWYKTGREIIKIINQLV